MHRLLLACSLAALLAGCPSDPEPSKTWQLTGDLLPGSLMSVWGTSATDVWTVGSPPRTGGTPQVLHFDGSTWTFLDPGVTDVDLWWVHGWEGGPIMIGGSNGTILRYDGTTWEAMTTPGTNVVFGIWGTTSDDVWAVGGAYGAGSGAFAWRFDGTEGTDVPLPAGYAEMEAMFKVWGRASNDVYLVGTHGIILHWDGSTLTPEFADAGPADMQRNLFTVHIDRDRAVAVGGFGNAVITENDGSGWRNVAGPTNMGNTGVWLTGDGGGYAVGSGGSIEQRTSEGWVPVDHGVGVAEQLHGVWVDPSGGVWTVGGQVAGMPFSDGIILHYGTTVPTVMF